MLYELYSQTESGFLCTRLWCLRTQLLWGIWSKQNDSRACSIKNFLRIPNPNWAVESNARLCACWVPKIYTSKNSCYVELIIIDEWTDQSSHVSRVRPPATIAAQPYPTSTRHNRKRHVSNRARNLKNHANNCSEQACVKRRSLELSGTSILLLLSCIDTFDDGIYKTTKYWATTTEGKNIYEFWKKAFQYSKPFNELALILPALFSMERFRSCPYPKEPALVSFTDFSWVLQTEGYKNLPFFEKMIKAMKGVAHYNGLQEENEDVIHRLELPLSKFSPMADALDSMFDYYCMRRIDPQQALSHLDAYKATLENVSSLYRDVLFELQITNSWLDVGYVEVIE